MRGADYKTKRAYPWMAVIGLLFVALFYFYEIYPAASIGPAQPIPFSHRVHAGVKRIDCRFCHPFVERSENAGLPAIEKCFFCHKYIIPDHPDIVREKAYLDSNKPVLWVQAFWVPDFVFFRHQPHVRWAGLDCSECHGDVRSMDRLPRVNFEMGFCVKCHRKMEGELDCWLACHR